MGTSDVMPAEAGTHGTEPQWCGISQKLSSLQPGITLCVHMSFGNDTKSGYFELLVMLLLAGLSFAGAPAYVALAGAALLMLSTLHEYAHLQPRFARAGATRLMAGSIVLAGLTSLAFASLCYAIGRFFAWLISL
jgi:hypothetical protein